ncbi:MAG: hypothetical protein KAY24_19710 [Candidatus Eisenbacteria sp.]|nr:hypothetical protein [Candidatus Eisenbacteria bacterium]
MELPLREDDLLLLKGRTSFDPQALCEAVGPLGFSPYLTTRWELIEAEAKHLIAEKGVSYIWQIVHLEEALLPKAADLPPIVALLKSMLGKLAPRREFVIVDQYLLSRRRPLDYSETLATLLEPLTDSIHELVLITNDEYDPPLLTDLKARLAVSGPTCRLVHRTSNSFHDRFWIADRQRGLFVGASLNGLGRRYALADFIAAGDVLAIVAALSEEGLLPGLPEKHT